ncbi:hypothetical protein [Sphaerotilus uruguayifluvii]|uniref:Uncharacterized protein n=1 Tax=Sphaerotilus uruguayifluvii TaxID=2735897 RepID=A0ABX2FXT2_9BURK|nr:hypothetical protein [Leptothrix sp. C29]NRT54782.1 hypothetical protein [Leptothrix sp. C29]
MSRAVPAVLLWIVMLVLVAQCMGCGGGDEVDRPDVLVLTDVPELGPDLARALPVKVEARIVATSAAPALLSSPDVASARLVVAHHAAPAATAEQTWAEHDRLCAAAWNAGMRCLITLVAADDLDQISTKRAMAAWWDGTTCDLRPLEGQDLVRALVGCVASAIDVPSPAKMPRQPVARIAPVSSAEAQ